jgi:hypothetical protein
MKYLLLCLLLVSEVSARGLKNRTKVSSESDFSSGGGSYTPPPIPAIPATSSGFKRSNVDPNSKEFEERIRNEALEEYRESIKGSSAIGSSALDLPADVLGPDESITDYRNRNKQKRIQQMFKTRAYKPLTLENMAAQEFRLKYKNLYWKKYRNDRWKSFVKDNWKPFRAGFVEKYRDTYKFE